MFTGDRGEVLKIFDSYHGEQFDRELVELLGHSVTRVDGESMLEKAGVELQPSSYSSEMPNHKDVCRLVKTEILGLPEDEQ